MMLMDISNPMHPDNPYRIANRAWHARIEAIRLHGQSEALVLALLDRMRAIRADAPRSWDVRPDYVRLRQVYDKAEARTKRRLYKTFGG